MEREIISNLWIKRANMSKWKQFQIGKQQQFWKHLNDLKPEWKILKIKKSKIIRQAKEQNLKGEFLEYLENNGIIKQTGTAYEHTHPGQMERIHQTIMTMGRAMLKNSKLPQKFYSDAQLTAVYLYNRQIHGNDSKTPYQHIY